MPQALSTLRFTLLTWTPARQALAGQFDLGSNLPCLTTWLSRVLLSPVSIFSFFPLCLTMPPFYFFLIYSYFFLLGYPLIVFISASQILSFFFLFFILFFCHFQTSSKESLARPPNSRPSLVAHQEKDRVQDFAFDSVSLTSVPFGFSFPLLFYFGSLLFFYLFYSLHVYFLVHVFLIISLFLIEFKNC